MNAAVHDLSTVVEARADRLAGLRRAVARFVRGAGGSAELASDLAIVVSELGTNVIRHTDVPTMTVSMHVDEQQWTVVVENDLHEHAEPRGNHADAFAALESPPSGGRGLAIVASLMDSISVFEDDHRLIVRATLDARV